MSANMYRLALAALCAAALASAAIAASARAAPAFGPFKVDFEGPCGLAVDSAGQIYTSNYHHDSVEVFQRSGPLVARIAEVVPFDAFGDFVNGPCATALAPIGALYVNNYHGNVVMFPPVVSNTKGPGSTIDGGHATGVAVDSSTGNVFVNKRTYIAVYEPSGAPVEVGGEPLRIGEGSLGDGYGVAVSAFLGTELEPKVTKGFVYVPDASDNTVKVYDPATDVDEPIQTIAVLQTIGGTVVGDFVSLRDSAVAVDRERGLVYVADNLQPQFSEHPEAAIYAFEPSGVYIGRLEYNIVDALPPGLAIDNSGKFPKGRVYVTSGNSENAAIYGYERGELSGSGLPAPEADQAGIATADPPLPALSAPEPASATMAPPVAADKSAAQSSESERTSQRPRRSSRHRSAGHRKRRPHRRHR